MKILAVDDHPDTAIALSMLFKLHGHETRIAYDGQQAIEVGEQFRPDLVLMDLRMPRLDGLEACRRMRHLAWGTHPTIIAVTGFGEREDRSRTAAAGFDGYLVKPVDFHTINETIAQAQQKLIARENSCRLA